MSFHPILTTSSQNSNANRAEDAGHPGVSKGIDRAEDAEERRGSEDRRQKTEDRRQKTEPRTPNPEPQTPNPNRGRCASLHRSQIEEERFHSVLPGLN